MPSGRAFAKRCLVIAGIVSLLAIATLPLLAAPPAAGGLWTQTTETDFLRGTWSNVEVLPGGDIQLSSNKTWSKEGLVMDLGPPSSPDNSGARAASVMKDGTTYRMWYTGYDGARLRGLYATSSDGLIWTRRGVAINVLTAPYNFDLIAGTSVIKEGSTYRMWFSGGYWSGGPFGELWARIYYAESTDAVSPGASRTSSVPSSVRATCRITPVTPCPTSAAAQCTSAEPSARRRTRAAQ